MFIQTFGVYEYNTIFTRTQLRNKTRAFGGDLVFEESDNETDNDKKRN